MADALKAKPEKQQFARNKDTLLDKAQAETPRPNALAGAAPAAAPAPAAPAAPALPALQPPSEATRAERAAGAGAAIDRFGTLNETVTATKSLSALPLPEIGPRTGERWRSDGFWPTTVATWEPQTS